MSVFLDELESLKASLVRATPIPTGDLGFGSDLDCADDLTADMAELPGDSPLLIAQSNYAVLTTPRGAVADAPGYGYDVRGLLNKGLTVQQITQIAGQVRAQLVDDDRNDDVSVTLTPVGNTGDFDLDIQGETAAGPYSLIFAVVDGEPRLKEITG